MTRTTIKILGAAIVILVIAAMALQNLNKRSDQSSELLLPDFRSIANDVTRIDLEWAADDSNLTLTRSNGNWTLVQRDNYAAKVSLVRQLIIALADAKVVEEKTSNSEFYSRLGVDDGGRGTSVTLEGNDGSSVSLLLGDQAQGRFRYARISDQEKSVLIDQDPDIPNEAGGWLVADILDINAAEVRHVAIAHDDGDVISAEKTSQDQTDFVVVDIPEGRELSYATVANGIAGALDNLTLEDVRPISQSSPSTTTTFQTWSGATVVAALTEEDDVTWIEFTVTGSDTNVSEPDESAAEPSVETHADLDVDSLGARLSGWQYRIVDHKKNLLSRRWDDLLKSIEDE